MCLHSRLVLLLLGIAAWMAEASQNGPTRRQLQQSGGRNVLRQRRPYWQGDSNESKQENSSGASIHPEMPWLTIEKFPSDLDSEGQESYGSKRGARFYKAESRSSPSSDLLMESVRTKMVSNREDIQDDDSKDSDHCGYFLWGTMPVHAG